jgi:hypothetical protein
MSGGSGTGTPVTIPAPIPTTAFEDMLAADLSAVFFNADEFAKSVAYTPAGGLAKMIKAIITYGEGEEYRGADALNIEATMEIQASDVATVSVGDSIAIGLEIWQVIDASKISDGLIWSCILSRLNR